MSEQAETHSLRDGSSVRIRPITLEDFEQSLAFFRQLPAEDRLYLRVDVTDPQVVRQRLSPGHLENVYRIVALLDDRIVADAALHWPQSGWMSHVGELRVIVAKAHRKQGLASIMLRHLFIHAVKTGLEKIEARIVPTQTPVRKCVEALGFVQEGVLPGFVVDLHGKRHDLIILSIEV